MKKPKQEECDKDLRFKVCGVCKKKRWIHKFDNYCSPQCKMRASTIIRNNAGII